MFRFMVYIGIALFAAIIAVGCATMGDGNRISDPAGRFSFAVGRGLTPKTETEGFYQYRMEMPGIDIFIVARQTDREEKGVEEVFRSAGAASQGGLRFSERAEPATVCASIGAR